MRPGTGPFTIAAALLLALGCGERDGVATSIVTGVTSNVTTLTPDTTTTTSSGTTTEAASGSASSEGDPSSTTTTGTTGLATTDVSTTSPDDTTTTGTTGSDPIEECLEMVDPGDECTACICTDCLELWEACHADEGCGEIQACAIKTGCYDFQCWADCQSIMLLWGPPFTSSHYLLWEPLTKCLQAGCQALCPW